VVVAGLVVEFYLAGAALFGVTTFQPHRLLGVLLAVAMLLLLVMALVTRPPRRRVFLVKLSDSERIRLQRVSATGAGPAPPARQADEQGRQDERRGPEPGQQHLPPGRPLEAGAGRRAPPPARRRWVMPDPWAR
jgi:hypothetical protein